MTVESYNTGSYAGLASGVDDFESTDLQLPRLKILHADAKFLNPQTEEEFDYLDCIVLGFVKQRVMFDPVYDDSKVDNTPWCKSNDHEIGFPGVEFPWDKSNRTAVDIQITELGNSSLPCKGCSFQNWGPKNPKNNKSSPPPCNELHTYAILYYNQGTQEYLPALISFKSSSIKASTSFMQNFVTSRRPIFTVFTRIELTSHRKGSVAYSVAKFSVIGDSPQENWADYSSQSISVREMLRAEPVIQGDESEEGEAQAYAPPAPAAPAPAAPAPAAPAPAAPAPAAAPASDPQVIQGQVVADPVTEPSHPAQGRTRPAPPKPPTPPARQAPAAPLVQAAPQETGPSEDSDDDAYMPF